MVTRVGHLMIVKRFEIEEKIEIRDSQLDELGIMMIEILFIQLR
jgi:isopropylmalate/homocitrate/citramalate synthase